MERHEIEDYPPEIKKKLLTASVVAQGGRGMKVEVAADYILSWIINGEFE